MKRYGLILLLLLMLAALCCLSACRRTVPEKQAPDAAIETPVTKLGDSLRLTMATGATSGNYYPFGSVLSHIIEDASDYIEIDIIATSASVENIEKLAAGEVQLAIAQNDVAYYAFNGIAIWQDKPPADNLTSLMSLYPEICQLIVHADSHIESVADLSGKRVALGEEGSAVHMAALQILEANGLSPEDMDTRYMSFSAATEAIKERIIDAFYFTVGTPNKGVMDLQAACDIHIVGLEEDVIEELMRKYSFYTKATLSSNDYSFLSYTVDTVAVQATLIADFSLGEQAAYDIVKAIIEGRDKLAVAHAKGSFISAESAVSGLGVKLHPGARRYYREIGAL
ncbi:MAG: TAXI family TRAP transporter solute-binding subunit [Clostridiales bacterium]|nr:TAXI family TRAP transporter solute-binding subunit [Clostridiales bacterium]